ncbi:hypothetical protein BDW71DRAFT_200620 [Aspergillus fruticulosus]
MSERFHTNDSDYIILGLYAVFLLYHALNKGRVYQLRRQALFWHILSGALEVILFYGKSRCSIAAVTACCVHSVTSLALVKYLPNGYPPHTPYQAGSILQPLLVIRAYCSQNPVHYHSSMMPLHGFVYTCALIFLLGTMGPSRDFIKNVNSLFVYAESVLGAALISVGHCQGSWPVPAYLILMHLLGKISLTNGVADSIHVRILRFTGLCVCEPSSEAAVSPQIGYLPADTIGEKYTKHI